MFREESGELCTLHHCMDANPNDIFGNSWAFPQTTGTRAPAGSALIPSFIRWSMAGKPLDGAGHPGWMECSWKTALNSRKYRASLWDSQVSNGFYLLQDDYRKTYIYNIVYLACQKCPVIYVLFILFMSRYVLQNYKQIHRSYNSKNYSAAHCIYLYHNPIR